MSVSRSTLTSGPAYAAYQSANFHFGDDTKVNFEKDRDDLKSSVYGDKANFYYTDRRVKASGTPLEYSNLAVMFPYLDMAIGTHIFKALGSDQALNWNSTNGDSLAIRCALVTKMPDLFLGVEKPMLGEMEFTGIVGDGMNPEDANSYYTTTAAGTYTPVGLTASNVKRQRYAGAWGSVTGYTALQAKEGWTITWELMLEALKIQGVAREFKFMGLRAMAKAILVGPTMAQIDAQLKLQGSGAAEGALASANVNDLVLTGSGVSVTVKKTAIVSAGYVFGGKPLRVGEVGFVSTLDLSSGTPTPVAIIA